MVEIVNRPYAKAFEAFAVARPEVLCLSADLTSSCEVDGFRDRRNGSRGNQYQVQTHFLSLADRRGRWHDFCRTVREHGTDFTCAYCLVYVFSAGRFAGGEVTAWEHAVVRAPDPNITLLPRDFAIAVLRGHVWSSQNSPRKRRKHL